MYLAILADDSFVNMSKISKIFLRDSFGQKSPGVEMVFEDGEIKIEKAEDLLIDFDLSREIINGVCRGCLGTDNLKIMTKTYRHEGKEETYSEMLVYCFSIRLEEPLERCGAKEYFICHACIKKLRAAVDFRNQLETAHTTFKFLLEKKSEPNEYCESFDPGSAFEPTDSGREGDDNPDGDPDFEPTVKKKLKRTKAESKRKKRSRRASGQPKNRETQSDSTAIAEYNKLNLKMCDVDARLNRSLWTRDDMKSAVKMALSTKLSLRKIAHAYGLPRTTLSGKVKRAREGKKVDFFPKRGVYMNDFIEDFEEKLARQIEELPKESLPLLKNGFLKMARDLVKTCDVHPDFDINTDASGSYFHFVFLKRHPSLKEKTKRENYYEYDENGVRLKKKNPPPFEIKPADLKCKICGEEFLWNSMLRTHMSVHYPRFVCQTCGHLSATRKQFHYHSGTHKEKNFVCKFCPDKRYKNSTSLRAHTRTIHLGDRNLYRCPICFEHMKSFAWRRKHLMEVHNQNVRKYPCKRCDKVFEAAGTLSKHVRQVHLNERNHICDVCAESFYEKRSLVRHMRAHTF